MATLNYKPSNIHALVNNITKQSIGSLPIEVVDTSSFNDLGKFLVTSDVLVNNWFNGLFSKYGRTEIISRVYQGKQRKGIKRSPLEWGAMIERITFEPIDAIRNPYGEIGTGEDGTISPYDRTHMSDVNVNVKTFIKKKGTFEFKIELPLTQVRDAFTSEDKFVRVVDGLITSMSNSMSRDIENLEIATVASYIAECAKADKKAVTVAEGTDIEYTGASNVLCNFIREFNDAMGYYTDTDDTTTYPGFKVTTRTYSGNDNALKSYYEATSNDKFVSWVLNKFGIDKANMIDYSTIYSLDGKNTFTPVDSLVFDVHADFANSMSRFVTADTFNKEYRQLTNYNEVSKFGLNLGKGAPKDTQKVAVNGVTVNNVVAVMRDVETIAIVTYDPRSYGKFDEENERNYRWSKMDYGSIVDGQFNGVVYTCEYEPSRIIAVEAVA